MCWHRAQSVENAGRGERIRTGDTKGSWKLQKGAQFKERKWRGKSGFEKQYKQKTRPGETWDPENEGVGPPMPPNDLYFVLPN